MEPRHFIGMIGIGWKFLPGVVIVKEDALYLFLKENEAITNLASGSASAPGIAGGNLANAAFGAVVTTAGAKLAGALQKKLYDKITGKTPIDSGDIKEGLNNDALELLDGVDEYIHIPKGEVAKVSKFGARTNFFHTNGVKYSFVPHLPKDKKPFRQVLGESGYRI